MYRYLVLLITSSDILLWSAITPMEFDAKTRKKNKANISECVTHDLELSESEMRT
jgi:hypothetical protein